MLCSVWLMLSTLLYSLQLNTGSFPKPLTEEEERRYLKLAQAGDLGARNVLIERNLRLVAHIMKKYYTQTSDQEDLISIGTIGLIKGITTFNDTKGARLATYAARCVENAILSPGRLARRERLLSSSLGDPGGDLLLGIVAGGGVSPQLVGTGDDGHFAGQGIVPVHQGAADEAEFGFGIGIFPDHRVIVLRPFQFVAIDDVFPRALRD